MVETSTGILPYDRVSDVNVIMTIVRPRPVLGLGNILILNPVVSGADTSVKDGVDENDKAKGILLRKVDSKSGAVYREYRDADAVSIDYSSNQDILRKVKTYFAQKNHSDRVAILDYDTSKVSDCLKAFWYFNWTFAIQATSKIDSSATSLSNIFEANKDHFLVLQSNEVSDFSLVNGQNYTIGVKHDLSEAMDAALIGAIATLTVGSVTWKFKQLEGITPETLTSNEVYGINDANAIAYEVMNSQGQTSEGKTMSGEYIDTIHGIIWVRANVQDKLESFLQENGKVPYNQNGITQLSGIVIQVLEQAYQQRIIQQNEATGKGDYSVTTSPRSAQSQVDLSNRHYGGLSFTYHAAGAIHTLTVNGEIDSDTITEKA
ncbi:DUF3383 family protein [Lactobacillus helveticus]|uniref:DUF3383 family protein n=1 Tax=Lactobacillus helveticus TaxID=1587 RepID=UPI00062AC34C|nr:DUF3383 family protein [Lactobacillus helveticus]AKG66648.1 hypothetical protein TU99_04845 [Lactobacillus helveticus]